MLQTISTKTIMNFCMSACKKIPVKRVAAFLGMFLFCTVMTFAQSKGVGGFQSAIREISGYETQVSNLMKAIGAVIAIVGAFSIYFKMQNGDQDVKKAIMLTIGAASTLTTSFNGLDNFRTCEGNLAPLA